MKDVARKREKSEVCMMTLLEVVLAQEVCAERVNTVVNFEGRPDARNKRNKTIDGAT